MYERILVPIDGSPTSDRGLEEAIRMARLTQARLRLVHVVDEFPFVLGADTLAPYTADVLSLLREAGEGVLARAKAKALAGGIAVDTVLHDTFQGRVCDLVVADANDWHADLIVIGTHGRHGVERVLLGSDAEQILRVAPVPVLLVRAGQSARPA
ncbi:MAG: universal stress protein [Aquabacterium sp.]|jgi:nucleotide-binding universal stress UspA family protein|nr:MAG: universal stress protein [Aquabacterium sp.]